MGGLETFLWALFGGIGAEIAVVFGLRHSAPHEFPYWLRSPLYYVVAALMVLAGGGIALAYARSGVNLNAILALQLGASAPLILRKLRDAVPTEVKPPDPAKID
jgi:hypothetical protein